MKEYYTQRASRPGTLLITEATFIAPQAGGKDNVPGIWSQEQITAWKDITDSVHEQGSYISSKFGATDAQPIHTFSKRGISLYGAPWPIPREFTLSEIQEYIALFAQAALNARDAGLMFLQDVSNQRTDDYGGSIENRSRFGLDVVKAVVDVVGADRVGVRITPWSTFQKPNPPIRPLVSTLKHTHPDLAYLHVTEPYIAGIYGKIHSESNARLGNDTSSESNDFLRAIWKPKPFISAGGYIRESALIRAERKGDIIAFGRRFIANPDLVNRLEKNIPLEKYDRSTFFTTAEDPNAAVGYIDYPFATKKDEMPVQKQL
ncbi:hypothetical protein BDQ17DRAFT_1363454 [Cyathus striatus]|nr:hypothetical protein BDQ17DRAFT_1363454 [Cyathus striatus]